MLADSLEELHEMARRIGLRREWYQNNPRHPHYDLRPSKRHQAIKAGAIPVTHNEMIEIMKPIWSNQGDPNA